ncbi:helix-turn-helix domain-containing protein [Nitratireductor soli]|uniref:helix-turn-helix domain-containing protein n=1 Tax=Nitratireductor soli TaxID=1670619 RepID=UPI0009E3F5CA|nr:helix-turn-helix domain-containing protein [Nitratireductor soli]
MDNESLVGIGVYTPTEASRLLHIPSRKITRWLKGHEIGGKRYERLWRPQIDLNDGRIYLGFRDLMEIRTAAAFMQAGVSAIMIRRAIDEAQKYVADERPLSTTQFRTDGHSIFLEIADESDDPKLLDLFKKQYAFKRIVDQSLKGVEFEGIAPSRWWPVSKQQKIVVDPERSFGQPIDTESGVPTSVLAAAARTEGVEIASKNWLVSTAAVRRAVEFETSFSKAA